MNQINLKKWTLRCIMIILFVNSFSLKSQISLNNTDGFESIKYTYKRAIDSLILIDKTLEKQIATDFLSKHNNENRMFNVSFSGIDGGYKIVFTETKIASTVDQSRFFFVIGKTYFFLQDIFPTNLLSITSKKKELNSQKSIILIDGYVSPISELESHSDYLSWIYFYNQGKLRFDKTELF